MGEYNFKISCHLTRDQVTRLMDIPGGPPKAQEPCKEFLSSSHVFFFNEVLSRAWYARFRV